VGHFSKAARLQERFFSAACQEQFDWPREAEGHGDLLAVGHKVL